MTVSSVSNSRALHPTSHVILVSPSGLNEITPESLTIDIVGQKAFGLACLPKPWTLPFFVISADFLKQYIAAHQDGKDVVLQWVPQLIEAAKRLGISPDLQVLIRSSGRGETIDKRGNLFSTVGVLSNVAPALTECLENLKKNQASQADAIPLVVQIRCSPESAKGHLSNERRIYEETRDWLGEFETGPLANSTFRINLRHWREKQAPAVDQPLRCNLTAHISEVLRGPAEWAYANRARVHFEWVWNGDTVFLVQADEETAWSGHDPMAEYESVKYNAVAIGPTCIRKVEVTDLKARRFAKIANVFRYLELGLATAPLYILDDRAVIDLLAQGKPPKSLVEDLADLVKGSLVIRTDVATADLSVKQLLPRTQELRDVDRAVEWLTKQSNILCNSGYAGAFIFHNFIPAYAAAFAYAHPGERRVQIEALWGLPEGLYYNSHDKYVVDLEPSLLKAANEGDFQYAVRERNNFKQFYVSTTPSGKWETLRLKPPFDWKSSLTHDDCRKIAHHSKRIAETEGQPLSIMWFIGVPKSLASDSVIPWYHEPFDLAKAQATVATRTKTIYDTTFTIRNAKDLDAIETEATGRLSRIRVQPLEEKLLRDKGTLKKIGELARKSNATIVLEGAVLSHAYYQLIGTGAVVEVVHPFVGFDERQEFNKLVRDKVPDFIQSQGERVTTARLDPESHIRGLREKLVEESYELLDAKDLRSIIAEMADAREVLDCLAVKLKIDEKDLLEEQRRKREKRGSLLEGVVLVETENIPPTSKSNYSSQAQFDGLHSEMTNAKTVDAAELRRRAELLDRRTDRRAIGGKIETQATFSAPVARSDWEGETTPERLSSVGGDVVTGAVRAKRIGASWHIQLTVLIDHAQLELPLKER